MVTTTIVVVTDAIGLVKKRSKKYTNKIPGGMSRTKYIFEASNWSERHIRKETAVVELLNSI